MADKFAGVLKTPLLTLYQRFLKYETCVSTFHANIGFPHNGVQDYIWSVEGGDSVFVLKKKNILNLSFVLGSFSFSIVFICEIIFNFKGCVSSGRILSSKSGCFQFEVVFIYRPSSYLARLHI